MNTERTDLTVFARDYPEARLVLEVKSALSSPPQEDPAVKQVMRYMWGANCHYGIIMTPTTTFILRDDFTAPGPGVNPVDGRASDGEAAQPHESADG